jgi:hypothetical protein
MENLALSDLQPDTPAHGIARHRSPGSPDRGGAKRMVSRSDEEVRFQPAKVRLMVFESRMRGDRTGKVGRGFMAYGIGVAVLLLSVAAFGWITGQMRVGFVRIHTSVEIDADKDAVWAVLANFDAYNEWNPLMIEVRGESRPGARMDWSSRLNGRVQRYNGRIDRAIDGRELVWTGPVSSFGRTLFWGQHTFTIEELADGRVRLTNAEEFGGLTTPVVASFLQNDVRAAYDAANLALKQRVESGQRLGR